jgi:hypothetical protein
MIQAFVSWIYQYSVMELYCCPRVGSEHFNMCHHPATNAQIAMFML